MDSPARFWDLYSHTYDAVRFSIPYRRLLDELVDALALEPGMRVLDLGCATGNLEERLGETAPAGTSITGVDHSEAMLRRARRRCRRFANVRFVHADLARPLPFPPDAFDRVVANNVLYALPERAAVVAEAARVLHPGGLLVLSDPKAGASVRGLVRAHFAAIAGMPPARRLVSWATTLVTLPLMGLAPILMITSSVARRTRAGEYRFSNEDEFAGLLAGFGALRVTTAYADQNWLAVAQARPAGSESRRTSSARSSDSSLPVNDITSA